MFAPHASPNRFGSIARRILAPALVLALAAGVAAGCSGSSSDDDTASGGEAIVADGGLLSWLPEETWLVASANVSADTIDEAVQTLDRLPVWSLAEGFLPAGDGKGLRREGLEALAKEVRSSRGSGKVTAGELEVAFGDRVGLAITDNDFSKLDADDAPVVGWVEVDDEDRAIEVARQLLEGTEKEREHEGVTIYDSAGDDTAFLVQDGLMLVAATPEGLEGLVDVHEGGTSLGEDKVGSSVIEASMGDELAGVAVSTDPVLAAVPDLLRQDADTQITPAQLDQLEDVLASGAVDGLVPDWVGGSATIDSTGLRFRGTWSNPRELADPKVGVRDLVERMPAAAPIVQAGSSDGSEIGRAQDAWGEVKEAYDIDLAELTQRCEPRDEWACDLGVQLALTVLEDEELATSASDADDSSYAIVQDLAPLMGLAANASDPTAKTAPLDARIYEFAMSGDAGLGGYTPPKELVDAAVAAGLLLTVDEDGTSVTVRVRPASPLALALTRELDPEAIAGLRAVGLDLAPLLSAQGLTIEAEQIDDLLVSGFPPDAPSKVVPALRGDVDTLGDSDRYRDVVKSAKPPKEVGQYGYVDLQAYVEAIFGAVAAGSPEASRALPTVRNNLADVPGVLTWTTREQVGGNEVGVYETVVPILE